jgi:hypothetical protein
MRIWEYGTSDCAKARYPYLALVSPVTEDIYIWDMSNRSLDLTIDASAHYAEGRMSDFSETEVHDFCFPRLIAFLSR